MKSKIKTLFQFHKVQLKDNNLNAKAQLILFQFHKVQLKDK